MTLKERHWVQSYNEVQGLKPCILHVFSIIGLILKVGFIMILLKIFNSKDKLDVFIAQMFLKTTVLR